MDLKHGDGQVNKDQVRLGQTVTEGQETQGKDEKIKQEIPN